MPSEINAIIDVIFPYVIFIMLGFLVYKIFQKHIHAAGKYLMDAFSEDVGAAEELVMN